MRREARQVTVDQLSNGLAAYAGEMEVYFRSGAYTQPVVFMNWESASCPEEGRGRIILRPGINPTGEPIKKGEGRGKHLPAS